MGQTRAQANRKVRQEALRDQLATQGHLQHVVDLLNEIADPNKDLTKDILDRYKIAVDGKLKLIGKFLPDVKAIEMDVSVREHESALDELE